MERVDIAIIGTGPAGVSAAITAKVRNKSVLLIGSRELSEKMSKAHQILNYPGLPEVSGADLVAGYKKQLAGLGIEVTEKRVNAVYAMGDYFGIQASGEILEASTVILAAGIVMGKRAAGKRCQLLRDLRCAVLPRKGSRCDRIRQRGGAGSGLSGGDCWKSALFPDGKRGAAAVGCHRGCA